MDNDPLFTVGHVARNRLLGVSSPNTILKMMDNKEIRWVDIADAGSPTRKPRIPQSSIDEYIKNRIKKVHYSDEYKPVKKAKKKSAANA